MALILTRCVGQRIMIGDHIVVRLAGTHRDGSAVVWVGERFCTLRQGYTTEIEPGVHLSVNKVEGRQAQIRIEAPSHIPVHREEIYNKIKAQELTARRQSMPDRVGISLCALFVALSSWPLYVANMVLA